jgi:DNA-binding MarR family transcriptional regulator
MGASTADDAAAREAIATMDPLSFDVFRTFLRTLHLHRQLMVRILSDEGAHPAQAHCLRVLAGHDGLSQSDLAGILLLSRPTVTTMLQRMERGGFVERRPDPEDQRVSRVFLTPKGRRLERHLRVAMARYTGRVLEAMSEEDRRELDRLLGTMADNIARAPA